MPVRSRCRALWPVALPLALALSACMPPHGDRDRIFGPYMDGPGIVAPERSIVVIPASYQEPLAVRREVRDSLLVERVVLPNDTALRGENEIRVQTRHRGTPYSGFFSGPLRSPFTKTAVARRVNEEFAGFDSITLPLERANRRGLYRYVVAEDGAEATCVYAWQMVDRTAEVSGNLNTYAIDFRTCSSTVRDAERLVRLFDDLDITPYL